MPHKITLKMTKKVLHNERLSSNPITIKSLVFEKIMPTTYVCHVQINETV